MGLDIISVFNPPQEIKERDRLLRDLACFGCEYVDECEDEWESGFEHCDRMMEFAEEFAEEHGLN